MPKSANKPDLFHAYIKAILDRRGYPYEELDPNLALEQLADRITRQRVIQNPLGMVYVRQESQQRFFDLLLRYILVEFAAPLPPADEHTISGQVGTIAGIPIRTSRIVPEDEVWLVSENPLQLIRFKLPEENTDANKHDAA